MRENTLQDLIETIKDYTGQTNLKNDKAVRAINYAADEYSRIQIFTNSRWKRDSANQGDIAVVTAEVTGRKASLETELIAIEYVDVLINGQYRRLDPTENKKQDIPLDTQYNVAGNPREYDYDNHHVYFYPAISGTATVRIGYRRAHPRFTVDNLTQNTGVVPIDDEFLALGGAVRVMLGKNDTAFASTRDMYERMKQDIVDSIPKQDLDTPKRMIPQRQNAFRRNYYSNDD